MANRLQASSNGAKQVLSTTPYIERITVMILIGILVVILIRIVVVMWCPPLPPTAL